MDKMNIDLENCYGINKLSQELDFSEKKGVLIYGANGIFKTSFSETFIDIIKGNKTIDRVHKSATTKVNITVDSNPIKPEQLFVVKSYEQQFSKERNISSLMVSDILRQEYEELTKEIEEKKAIFIEKLKEVSHNKAIEKELTEFLNQKIELENILKIKTDSNSINFDLENILYTELFNSQTLKIIENPDFKKLIGEYINIYDSLITTSPLFKKGVFNHNNIEDILSALDKNKFFEVEHKIKLNTINDEISNIDDFKGIIEEEKKRILTDKTLSDKFSKIEKLISNTQAKRLREILEIKRELIVELSDIKTFKNKIWKFYFLKADSEIENWTNKFNENRDKISKIIEKAKLEKSDWDTVIELYKKRFIVPFEIQIKNRENSLLKIEQPQLEFTHTGVPIEEEELKNILSQGEKRALYILETLYEIEKRKKIGQEVLLILDDISDSFDYKNKYAIIEYLNDIKESGIFKLIILTHNFDFYRTVAGRLDLNSNKYMAIKENNEIKLLRGEYTKTIFTVWKKNVKNNNSNKIFLASIPFVRNLVEYSKDDKDVDYLFLTKTLHMKAQTATMTIGDIYNIFNKHWGVGTYTSDKKFIVLLYEECDKLLIECITSKIELENKIILSMGSRLKAETYMINKLNTIEVEDIKGNQTSFLLKEYKKNHPNSNNIKLLEQVQMMTPENIHINSFMYEPLLDMSDEHLKDLYAKVSKLI